MLRIGGNQRAGMPENASREVSSLEEYFALLICNSDP